MPPTVNEGLFKSVAGPRDKAESTTAAARAIIADEAAARIRKTERLRQLRLEATPVIEEKPARKTPARKSPARKRPAGKL